MTKDVSNLFIQRTIKFGWNEPFKISSYFQFLRMISAKGVR